MSKKKLIVIGILIITIILICGCIRQPTAPTEEQLSEKFSEFEIQYDEKKAEGYDVTEAEALVMQAKQAYDEGDYKKADKLLDEAFSALEKAETPTTPAPMVIPSPEELAGEWTPGQYIENQINFIFPSDEEIMSYEDIDDLEKLSAILRSASNKLPKQIPAQGVEREIERMRHGMRNIDPAHITQQDKENLISIMSDLKPEFRQSLRALQEKKQEYYGKELDSFIERWKPTKYYPMTFGVQIPPSYRFTRYLTTQEIIDNVRIVDEVGADLVRFDIVYDFWLHSETENIKKIDSAVEEARKRNLKVYLGIYGVEEWGGRPVSWETWKNMYIGTDGTPGMVKTIMTRYQPDYVELLPEGPYLCQNQVNEDVPMIEWVKLAAESTELVKQISPSTIVVINTVPQHPGYENKPLLKDLMDPSELLSNTPHLAAEEKEKIKKGIKKIDVIGIDPYSLKELKYDYEYAEKYWNKDKELWIAETWSSGKGVYIDNLDDKYIKGSIYYAQSNGMTGYILFFGRNLHTKDFGKTPAFYTYNDVIEEVRNNTI